MHGNRICTEPLCTRVGDDCSLISSPDVNNKSACKQACINKETCKMAAYHQTTGCNLYKCTVCYLQTNGGNNQAIYMCTYVAGNVRTNASTSILLRYCFIKKVLCGLGYDL